MISRPVFSLFRLQSLALLLLFLGLVGSQQACLPGPTTLQVEAIINCSERNNPITLGSFDVAVSDSYFMRVLLINNLALLGNPSQFIPETNYIDLKEVKVWFEYPTNFSRISMGSALLRTQENPLILPIAATLRPTLVADFIGQGAGGGTGSTIQGEAVPFHLIPTELSRLWYGASELDAKSLINQDAARQSGASFSVIAHITISGITRSGQLVATPEYRFPIRICKGCLDAVGKKAKPSTCTGAATGIGGADCTGQDGVCTSSSNNP